MSDPEMQLQDFKTPTWKRLEAVLIDRLSSHQKMLENDLDDVQTAKTRGRIKEIRYLLDLEESSTFKANAE